MKWLVAALVLVATPAIAQAPDAPRTSGFVVDGATVIPDDVERRIDTRLREHQRTTTNEVVVMTLPTSGGQAIEAFAKQVFNTLGIGRKDKNNGVLLLLAMDDRKLRIQVGTGLESVLTNAEAKAIVDGRMVPALKVGDPGRAVRAGVEGVLTELGDPAPVADDPKPQDEPVRVDDGGIGLPSRPGVEFRGFEDPTEGFRNVLPFFVFAAIAVAGMAIYRAIAGVGGMASGMADGPGYGQGVWFGRHNRGGSWADDSSSRSLLDSSSSSSSFGGGSSSSSSSSSFGGGSTSGGGASGSW